MRRVKVVSVLIFFHTIGLTLTAPSFGILRSSVGQLLTLNLTSNTTSYIAVPNPSYEEYDIPETDLSLHLALLHALDRFAMQSCLQTASIWVGCQRQSDTMPKVDFEWKDPAGALLYIRSLSKHLRWADLKSVLRGLKEDLEDKQRYVAASFTVEEKSTQQFIGQGRLSRYKPPEPTLFPMAKTATSSWFIPRYSLPVALHSDLKINLSKFDRENGHVKD